jgi:hypothetical protein
MKCPTCDGTGYYVEKDPAQPNGPRQGDTVEVKVCTTCNGDRYIGPRR